MSRAPVAKFRSGISPAIQIAVWAGEKGYNFTIQKRYKDKSGQWVEGKTLFASDLAALAQLAPRAIALADDQREIDRENGQGSQPSGFEQKFEQAPAAQTESVIDDDDIPF